MYDGINVDVIHAERSQLQRDNVVKSFRSGQIWVLICTELMGRGIDFKGVNLVVNYDFPPSAISYIHRIGTYYCKLLLFSISILYRRIFIFQVERGAPDVQAKQLLFSQRVMQSTSASMILLFA